MKLLYRIQTGQVVAWYSDTSIDIDVPENHALIDAPESVAIPEAIVRVAQNEDPMFIVCQDFIDSQWATVKQLRQQKLLHTDWMFSVSDGVAPRKEEWGVYRQALRDITKQANPFALVWPVEPSATNSA